MTLDEIAWEPLEEFEDILFLYYKGMAKISINRPEVHNAFRPKTVFELSEAFELTRQNRNVGVVILTGEGGEAFCSGGDQKVRDVGGYVGSDGVPRLNILDVQKQIRSIPKPVVAMVAGWAIGGGHVLHVICDLTIAAENARFGQTGPKVGSFDDHITGLVDPFLDALLFQAAEEGFGDGVCCYPTHSLHGNDS